MIAVVRQAEGEPRDDVGQCCQFQQLMIEGSELFSQFADQGAAKRGEPVVRQAIGGGRLETRQRVAKPLIRIHDGFQKGLHFQQLIQQSLFIVTAIGIEQAEEGFARLVFPACPVVEESPGGPLSEQSGLVGIHEGGLGFEIGGGEMSIEHVPAEGMDR